MEEPGKLMLPTSDEMDARRVYAALSLLCKGGWWTLADLVRETAASRRAIEALLAQLGPERSGNRFRLTADQVSGYGELLSDSDRPFTPADPVEHLMPAHAEIVDRLAELIAGVPRTRQALDQVSATPETVVRRALLLGARFWLSDTGLLCVGDHDLTSLAIGMVHPYVQTTVIDIDERVLAYIDTAATELGIDVRTRWADLRLGLPQSVRGTADLAITDPPYTPDGIGLFVARATEGLRDPLRGRVLLAYGASERTPALALKVQKALLDLNLVSEAIYPDFNRYFGAEAIGSAADLYVLRPTTKSLPAATALVERVGTAIYSQGSQSVESRDGQPPPAGGVTGDVDGDVGVGGDGFAPNVLVGTWPKDLLPKAPRARLTTWLARPYAAAVRDAAIALPAGMEAALTRVLLASRAEHTRVLTAEPAEPAGHADLAEVLAPIYELSTRGRVIDAVRRPPGGDDDLRLLHTIMERAHGKLANSWREALIGLRAGLTKRQARRAVLETASWAEDVTLLELPMHRLRDLPRAARASLTRADEIIAEAPPPTD